MNFFAALFGIVFASIIILPLLMLASVLAWEWWPVMLFLVWGFIALVRGKVF